MRLFSLLSVLLLVSACAGSESARNDTDPARGTRSDDGLVLAPDAASVRTVQFHARGDETALPLVGMGSGNQLRLAFDMAGQDSRPLSVWFYHADRSWRRDLFPAEYMARFQDDVILDYRPSSGTLVPYIHYEYAFPNDAIDFTLSGNYVLRVSEQGREDDILLERAFYVAEEATTLDTRLESVLLIGAPFQGLQPFVRFRPDDPAVSPFDYTACFVRNHHLDGVRCAERPSLAGNPELLFYLEQEEAFIPTDPVFYLHLGDVRTGGKIERVDQGRIPWQVWLEPDQARFPGSFPAPFLNGQSVVARSVPGVAEPRIGAEYVEVTFRFIPLDSVPAEGGVRLAGSFTGWHETGPMAWNSEAGWYELTIPVKQGQHEYRYVTPDLRNARALSTGQAQFGNRLTTLVYLDDVRRQTDRLVAATTSLVP